MHINNDQKVIFNHLNKGIKEAHTQMTEKASLSTSDRREQMSARIKL